MVDSEEKKAPASVPDWQQRREPDEQTFAFAPSADHLDFARRFLEDDNVKAAPRHKKIDFLKSKGIEEDVIKKLLGKPEDRVAPDEADITAPKKPPSGNAQGDVQSTASQQVLQRNDIDRPPIVTYPEFLAKSPKPPPLVTTSGLLTTLYGFAGLFTLLCGTNKYYVAPMVEDLTVARFDLHEVASHKLRALIADLERTVSVVPAGNGQQFVVADNSSDAEDPSEMFHRDVGTQTSPAASPAAAALMPSTGRSELDRQADRLSEAAKSLARLKEKYRTHSEDLEDVRTLLDVFRDDLDGMTYGGQAHFAGGYDVYGTAKRAEPEDEIRKVRDNIRRVKGILLSTRSFPASTR